MSVHLGRSRLADIAFETNAPKRTSGLPPSMTCGQFGQRRSVPEQLPPRRPVACIFRSSSRREIADKLLDAGQDGLLIAREDPLIGAIELDESRLRNVTGEMAPGVEANGAVAVAVEQQLLRTGVRKGTSYYRSGQIMTNLRTVCRNDVA
jgi:hypothetical protein